MKSQRGNILFLILLAVVLFAALSYAVTNSIRGEGKNASRENADSKAATLVQYFAQINTAVDRMRLSGGLQDYQINFYQSATQKYVFGNNDNTNCTTSNCRVFDPAGGGVTGQLMADYLKPTSDATNIYPRITYNSVYQTGITNKPEILLNVGGVTQEICRAINRRFGYDDIIYSSPNFAGPMYQYAIPTGPIPDNGTTTFNAVPKAALVNGTFCTCGTADWATCDASVYQPSIIHIILTR